LSSCWGNCVKNFFFTQWTEMENRKLTLDSYKSESHYITYRKKDCYNFKHLQWVVAKEIATRICYTLYRQLHGRTGSWHRIPTKMTPIIWHAQRKSVLKFQAPAMSGCWGHCNKNFLNTQQTDPQINRKLTLNSYKNWNPSYGMSKERVW
jgi:hypothetical protein